MPMAFMCCCADGCGSSPEGAGVRAKKVERTVAWLMFQRRLARDDELLEATTENLVYIALIRLMLKILAC
ncbi:MAG: hypothetical protein HC933_09330 [Pleurocapsa sp. SU_196_0]|nr:hypothetical protein [Pleurocapsa sp. SU_196_0]